MLPLYCVYKHCLKPDPPKIENGIVFYPFEVTGECQVRDMEMSRFFALLLYIRDLWFYEWLSVGLTAVVALLSVIGLYALVRHLERTLKKRAEWHLVKQRLYQPESFRANSPYLDAPPVSSQIQFWSLRNGTKTLIGHGIRIVENSRFYILAPVHVVRAAGKNARLFTSFAYKTEDEKIKDSVASSELQWRQLMNDVCIAVPPPNVLKAGKTSAVGPVKGKIFAFISTGHTTDKASMGELSTAAFGLLKYEGSTRAAFSGAAYMVNNRVVGMHLGGGCQNLGVASSYILAHLRKTPFLSLDLLDSGFGIDDVMIYDPEAAFFNEPAYYRPEAYGGSELEYLKRALKNARVDDWSYAHAGLDDMEVEYNGVYYVLERAEFDELMQELDANFDDDDGLVFSSKKKRARRKEKHYDYEPEAAVIPSSQPPETFEMVPSCTCGYDELYQLIKKHSALVKVDRDKMCDLCRFKYALEIGTYEPEADAGNSNSQNKPPVSGKKLKEAPTTTVVQSPTNQGPSTSRNQPDTTGLQKTQTASNEVSESTQTSDSEYEEVVLRKKKRRSPGRRRRSGTQSGSQSKAPQTGNPPTSKQKSLVFSGTSKKTPSPDSASSKMNQLLVKLLVGTELSSSERKQLISSLPLSE